MAMQFGLLEGTTAPRVTRIAQLSGAQVSSELPECRKSSLTSVEICGRHGSRSGVSISCAAVDPKFGNRAPRDKMENASTSRKRIFAVASGQSFASTEVAEKDTTIQTTTSTTVDTSATSLISSQGNPDDGVNGASPGETPETGDATVPSSALTRGSLFRGIVSAIHSYGVFVRFGAYADGLVHISKLGSGYVRNVHHVVSLGQEVSVIVLNVEQSSGRIALSMVQGDSDSSVANNASSGQTRGTRRGRFPQRSKSGHFVPSTGKTDKEMAKNPLAPFSSKAARVAITSGLPAYAMSAQSLGYCGG